MSLGDYTFPPLMPETMVWSRSWPLNTDMLMFSHMPINKAPPVCSGYNVAGLLRRFQVCVRAGTKNGKRPLAVFCKSKLLSLETHKPAGRGGDGGGGKVKLTTTAKFSSVSTLSQKPAWARGEVTALRHQSPSLLPTAQALESDRKATLTCTLVWHVSWGPRNQT